MPTYFPTPTAPLFEFLATVRSDVVWARWYVGRTPQKAAREATRRKASPDRATRLKSAAIRNALRTSGQCEACGRELTDPVSIEAGKGPECRAKEGNAA